MRPADLFLYRLAAALGCADPDGLGGRLSVSELRRWMAYDRIEPLGYRGLEDLVLTAVAATRAALGSDTNLDSLSRERRMEPVRWPTEEEIRRLTQRGKRPG